jgi:UDP:flavonoid glycosyltransferase YjiC (YdhE family)
MGSVQEALYHGVPLVCYPQMIEQSIVASQVARLGVGIVLGSDTAAGGERDGPTPSVEQLRAAVEQVQRDPSYKARARVVGEELRRCSAAQAADIVQDYVQRQRLRATSSA